MKINAKGATDGANIVLFWPDNLPDDADDQLQDDPITLIEDLRDQGKLIWFSCEGDGEYTVAIFHREPIPDDLLKYCENEERYPTLHVNGGGYFGGMEYIFKRDSSFLDKYPHMCEPVAIPDGEYSANVYCTNVPEKLYETWIVENLGRSAKRWWDFHGYVAALAIAGVFASLVGLFVMSWTIWYVVMASTILAGLAAVVMSRTETYKAVANAQREFEQLYPSYVVELS